MENIKEKFEKFQNQMVLKDQLALVVITLQERLRDSQKEMKKQS